jgi:CheY-like chemotaxis protein
MHPAHILIIDDDVEVAFLVAMSLEEAGHQVAVAETGHQGVTLFENGHFDVVLTDLGMPDMTGWEVTTRIKALQPDVPVFVVTGWGDQLNTEEQIASGADLILTKPFDLDELLHLIAQRTAVGMQT